MEYRSSIIFLLYALVAHSARIPKQNCRSGDMFPYEGSYTRYYLCKQGLKVNMDCPEGFFFNPDVKVCDSISVIDKKSQPIRENFTSTLKPRTDDYKYASIDFYPDVEPKTGSKLFSDFRYPKKVIANQDYGLPGWEFN